MAKNPITTVIGVLIALCPVVGFFYPDLKSVCDNLMGELVGLGFIASADGVKMSNPTAPKSLGTILMAIGVSILLVTTLSACSSFLTSKAKIEAILDDAVAGDYIVEVKKDGKTLLHESWVCADRTCSKVKF